MKHLQTNKKNARRLAWLFLAILLGCWPATATYGQGKSAIEANQASLLTPTVAVNPTTIYLGGVITLSGQGFTPNGSVVLHEAFPNGQEILPAHTVTANASGAYSTNTNVGIAAYNYPVGTYRHWAVDQSTGTSSNNAYFTATPAHIYVITNATTNKTDANQDGYFEQVRLSWTTSASSGYHQIYGKLYRRNQAGAESFLQQIQFGAAYSPGDTFSTAVAANSSQETWSFRMAVFARSDDSLVASIEYGDSDWSNLPMWDGAVAFSITDVGSLPGPDNDGDGYYESLQVNWRIGISEGQERVYGKLYFRNASGAESLVLTTPPYTVVAGTANDLWTDPFTTSERSIFDFRVDVYRVSDNAYLTGLGYNIDPDWIDIPLEPGSVSMTITSDPAGRTIVVDGSSYVAPQTFGWQLGSQHTLSVSSPQSGTTGTRYVYTSWSDGGGQTHTITVPAVATTITSNFRMEYLLTLSNNPSNAGSITVNPSGTYFASGTQVSLSAIPNAGYSFSSWSGDASGNSNPISLTMNGPKSVVANYTSLATPTAIVASSPQYAGTEFWVETQVGTSTSPVNNLFGLSFVLNFTQTTHLDVVMPYSVNVLPGAFMGSDPIFYQTVDEPSGKVSVGISRKSGQGGVSGYGIVLRVKFYAQPTTPNGTQVLFSLSDIIANDPSGNPITLNTSTKTIRIDTGVIVWPGDANNDGTVNQADVLPIGLYWNFNGSPRANASSAWVGQVATPWSPAQATYADANGNGHVDQADVLPIGLNWGRTHGTQLTKSPLTKSDQTLRISLTPEDELAAVAPDQTFWLDVFAIEAEDLFGMAAELSAKGPSALKILAIEPSPSFGDDVIFFSKVDEASDRACFSVSRKSPQSGFKGTGAILRLEAQVSEYAKSGESVSLTLSEILAIDGNGASLQTELSSPTLELFVSEIAAGEVRTITVYQLYSNYPNPFNPETLIRYDLPYSGEVKLEIFNVVGQRIRSLTGRIQEAGSHDAIWNGRDDSGREVPSGIYCYRLQARTFVAVRKMTLLR